MRYARYRGRHRNPSNTSRLTAVGVVGAGALAASVISPSIATAATSAQWDRVANCESGDNWHTNTGNGYYGGLQFADHTWDSFDTDDYASRADLASRKQQIDVANRVLNSQGWGAWPVCSQYRGEANSGRSHHRSGGHGHHRGHSHGQTDQRHVATKGNNVVYTVRRGDTLESVARHHHVKGGWHALYRHNRHVIGDNPSIIHAGMKLQLRNA
jgi:hypothetical protein